MHYPRTLCTVYVQYYWPTSQLLPPQICKKKITLFLNYRNYIYFIRNTTLNMRFPMWCCSTCFLFARRQSIICFDFENSMINIYEYDLCNKYLQTFSNWNTERRQNVFLLPKKKKSEMDLRVGSDGPRAQKCCRFEIFYYYY